MPAARRIVVATGDIIGPKMAGPGIRAWHLAEALSTTNEVELVTTASANAADPRFVIRAVDDDALRHLEQWCDVFIFQGWLLEGRPFLRSSSKVLIVDLYDPMHLEQLEQLEQGGGTGAGDVTRTARARAATAVLNQQLLRGDFFLCASERQRTFWLGHLAALGRINACTYDADKTLRALIDVVPFGVPEAPPVRRAPAIKGVVPGIAKGDLVVLWGGGVYDWFDPLTLLRAVDRLRRAHPRVRLFFLGMAHPSPDVPEMAMATETRSLSDSLRLTGNHVFFNEGWVDHALRQDYLLDADIGVTTHLSHLETELSFRTRVLDYIWAGLPVVATEGDSMAQLVESRGIGLTVPPADVNALEFALGRLLGDAELRSNLRQRCRVVASELAWPKVTEPLVEFCRAPRRAPDLLDPDIVANLPRRLGRVTSGRPFGDAVRAGLRHLRAGGPRELVESVAARLRRSRG
ncbi:MAG TPA: glycosyltransferase [Acidimicrobiales bacterium]|nr:glycosyltransferase [Acidimicrobiales bacterium]